MRLVTEEELEFQFKMQEDYVKHFETEEMLDEFSSDYNGVGYLFIAEQANRIEDDERDEVEDLL